MILESDTKLCANEDGTLLLLLPMAWIAHTKGITLMRKEKGMAKKEPNESE